MLRRATKERIVVKWNTLQLQLQLQRGATAAWHMISNLQQLSSTKQVEQAQALITKSGLHNHTPLISKLVAFYSLSPSGSLVHAHSLFEQTAMDNSFVCNTMIRAYAKSVVPIQAIRIYNHMQFMAVESDHFTFNFVLKACARACKCMEDDAKSNAICIISCKGSEIHGRIMKLGFAGDFYVQDSLVYMYSHCMSVVVARQMFDEMTERSIASWNIIISGYDRINDFESADSLLALMPRRNVISWNILLARCIRLSNIEVAMKVFQDMPEKDSVSWNSIISGYIHVKNYDKAMELFHKMQNDTDIKPTQVTYVSVLGACAETGALDMGKNIHKSLKENKYRMEGYLGNALVDMYAKCGHLNSAWEVFNELKMRPISCWNAMIMGLAVHGHSEKALELFASMEIKRDGVKPNRVTFIALLIACSHKGLVGEGRLYFKRMMVEYGIEPDLKHYGCMIDLLSRWGLLDEACQMIKTCPFHSSSVLWRTLLGACRVHGHVELGEESFKQLAKIEALRDGDYVLLSNIYAEGERWDDVERLRNRMIHLGVSKRPGSSHVQSLDLGCNAITQLQVRRMVLSYEP